MTRLTLLLALLFCCAVAGAADYSDRDDVRSFIAEMHERHGFDAESLTALFRRAEFVPGVIKAIEPPSEPGARSWHSYRARFVDARRISAGARFWQRHARTLAAARERFGVPEEIIVAIIGVETIYGRQKGRFQTFSALTTLAFDYPPRAALFRRELENLLLLAREERRDPLAYHGSYAGALGMPQFLPSSQRRYALDFDGSGGVDLAESPADAIGSVANFLMMEGWQPGAPISVPVEVGVSCCAALLEAGIEPRLRPAEMEAFGVVPGNAPDQPAALIDLATPEEATEYRLGYRNFYVITRYNRSSFYAAAVQDLAEALAARHRRARRGQSRASRPRPSR